MTSIPTVPPLLSIELIATIEQQKRTIRKLNLKLAKLESALNRERTETSKNSSANHFSSGKNSHYEMLKQEVEKSNLLEMTLMKIASKINLISSEVIEKND